MDKTIRTTADALNAEADRTAATLRHLEHLGASRALTSEENTRYRLVTAEHRQAVADLAAYVGAANVTDSSLAIALANAHTIERGTARSVALRDLGTEVRGTATLVEGTAGVGGNTVNADAVGADIFRTYRDHRDLLRFIPEELVTVRASTVDVPTLTAGVTLTAPGENSTVTVSDVAFGRIPVSFTKVSVRTTLSYELLNDQPFGLESFVVDEHGRAAVRNVETSTVAALVADAGNAVAAAPTTLATILDGAIAVEADGWTPSVAVLSPADWGTLRKASSADLGSPERFKERTGLDLVLSSSIATGTGLVLDPAAARVYRRSMVPVRVIRSAAGFATDTIDVVSTWRVAPKVLAADGVAKLTV